MTTRLLNEKKLTYSGESFSSCSESHQHMDTLHSLSLKHKASHRKNRWINSKTKQTLKNINNVENFVAELRKLFDIFIQDKAKRIKLEINDNSK